MKLRARKVPEQSRWYWNKGFAYGANTVLAIVKRVLTESKCATFDELADEVLDRIEVRLFPGRFYLDDTSINDKNLSDFEEGLDNLDRI